VSSIWTPGGEHPVPPPSQDSAATGPAAAASRPRTQGADSAFDPSDPLDSDALDPEVAEQLAEQLAEAHRRILSEPVDVLVSNHVMGLYELAAIHLSAEDPDLEAARLPIDAMGILVDGLGDRLAEHATLINALQQIRLAYVHRARPAADAVAPDDEAATESAPANEAQSEETA
jgi:hypothetical protein